MVEENWIEKAKEDLFEKAIKRGVISFEKPPKKYLDILQDKDLFERITVDEFEKKIVGEVDSRKVIFLCAAGGRLVRNCQIASYNVLVNDEAGAGKDYVSGKVLELIPKEVYIHKTRISPTVLTYWKTVESEPDWTWDGKVFYPEDISENVLNSEVFKVMSSNGSKATITIRQKAVDLEVRGKPVIITTTATATPNPELVRRFVILNLDSSEGQTKAIMKRHCEYASKGFSPEYNEDLITAQKFLKGCEVKIEFANLLAEVLPAKSIIMRTHLPRFLDYIKASAAFHQYQRRRCDSDFVLAEEQDYEIARECFAKLSSNKYMIPLTINQKKILSVFETNRELKGSASQLHATSMNFMSLKALITNLGLLTKYSILESGVGKDSYGRDLEVYSLAEAYKPDKRLEIPSFKDLCRINSTSKVSKPCISSKVSKPSKKDVLLIEDVLPKNRRNLPNETQQKQDQDGIFIVPEEKIL